MCLLRFGGQTPAVDTPAAPGPAYTPEPEDSPEPNNTPEPEPSPGPEPTPAPTPEPTPEPDPGLPAGRLVTVDGLDLASGSVVQNGVEYVRLSELAEALAVEPESTEAGQITFPWRKQTVSLALDQVKLSYGELSFDMAQPVIRYREELWVPVEDLCRALDISLLDDEEMGHLYCTPGAGAWALEEDRRVWVTMYHGVSDNGFDNPELYVRPSTMREQIEWLLDNGCDPIFFEDLWHLEDYDKPILLTYDDGYSCMYTDLFPILQEYQVKATIFLVTDDVYNSEKCLNWDQVREMQDSGLVSFQSHTVTHPHLSQLSREEQEKELADSRLVIARELGKEPFALAYPYGDVNGDTYEVTPSWYRFAVRMSNPMGMKLDVYVTGQNPVEIYRFYVPRSITLERFASRLVW